MRSRHPVSVVKQRNNMDCGVAALAMLLGKSYGDVAYAVKQVIEKFPKRGLGLIHLEQVSESLGYPLKRVYKKKNYLESNPVGVLGVVGGRMCWAGHWVIWKEGVIVDPDDGKIYGLDEFTRIFGTRTCTMLVLR